MPNKTVDAIARARAYQREYRKRPAAMLKDRAYDREYMQRPDVKERRRALYAVRMADPHYREAQRLKAENWNRAPGRAYEMRLRRYGLTHQMFVEYLDAQEGCCAFCGTPLPKDFTRFSIDHDHSTGAVRGFVHDRCNNVIAHADAHYSGYIASASAY